MTFLTISPFALATKSKQATIKSNVSINEGTVIVVADLFLYPKVIKDIITPETSLHPFITYILHSFTLPAK
jgi:hypothetical protein